MKTSTRRARAIAESLERRQLLTSTSILLQYDFNGANAWPLSSASTSAGGSAAVSQGAFGTVDTQGATTPSGAIGFTAIPPVTGPWHSTFTSGTLAVSNAETNLGKLTLSFSLSASQADPVKLILYSCNTSGGAPTGGLETTIYPAAANYNQRFAVDLSTMKPSGLGTFSPTAGYLSVNYEISSLMGWSASTVTQLNVDNVNYSKPAYYVSPSGNNTNGLTEATAFRTPQQAVNVSQPGDVVLIMSGTYIQPNSYTGPIVITKGGTPADWVVLKNYPGQTPEIYNQYWNAVLIGNGTGSAKSTGAAIAYLEIRGLDIHGNADIAATAYNSSIGAVDGRTNGNGISVNGGNETNFPHDLRFANNIVEYNCGGGIGVGDADRVQIENNLVRYNCWWTIYATSGISILSAYNFDGTTNNYTRVIRGNTVFGNQCYEKWATSPPRYSDGNGIILDINHNDGSLPNGVTVGRSLISDCVTYNNGGGGIHAFKADHVDMFNNVAYLNSASPNLQYAEMDGLFDTDVRIYNNIMVAPVANLAGGQTAEPVNGGTASFFQNNLYYGGNTAPLMGSGDRILDARFVSPSIDPATADFRLQSNSPAIDGAVGAYSPAVDILNNVRNGLPDIGAYEYYPSVPTVVTQPYADASPVIGNTARLNVLAGDNDGPAGLVYTWAVTSIPAGALTPTFSANNGTSVANSLSVTFTRAGSYTFNVTVTDAYSNSLMALVNVVVNQSAAAIAVSPNTATVAGGTTQLFTASAVDQFGQTMTPTLAWATTSGTISSGGILTAGQTGGTFTVSAFSNGVTGTASIFVVPTSYAGAGAGYYIRLSPDNVTEQIWVGSPGSVGPLFTTPTYSIALGSVPWLSFGPATGAESFTIDLSYGKPIPTNGLSYDGGAGSDTLKIIGGPSNDLVTVNATQVLFGSTPITVSAVESIVMTLGAGSDTLIQTAQPGIGTSVLWTDPTGSDSLNISGGSYTLPASTNGIMNVAFGSIAVGSGAALTIGAASVPSRLRVVVGTLSLPPAATLDLGGNDLIAGAATFDLTTDALSALTAGTGGWGSPGLTTSAPSANPLRALGIGISTGQAFDNQATTAGSILVKTTYFGDATLDGKVDGSDYSRIDSGYQTQASGWSNGDFNYDGVINGSDYTLIDNAFNTQGASMAAVRGDQVAALPKRLNSFLTAEFAHPAPTMTNATLLFTLVEPNVSAGDADSIFNYFQVDGWAGDVHSAHQFDHMQNGSNADVSLADAYVKHLPGIQWDQAYAPVRKIAFVDANPGAKGGPELTRLRLNDFRQFHYVPVNTVVGMNDVQAVSRILEYIYDDSCV